ncbi:Spo7-like protein-domain-containing protein [Calycina marina]|uniref:Spo7-like protein-domain-containing protein n=1 Tax=Calycina marina TaxID=1763456 RepID=A0A9P7Z739_9HELO|nr:Spo7-like protein-domain-containing protein [Calycina marina]
MSNLDQIVKGAPPPGTDFPAQKTTPVTDVTTANPTSDPAALLPSSPPQIYLNLLILEASLRAQWLQLRTRRRQHTFFVTLLSLWILYFDYALFLAPREDGSGVGGSVYWVVEVTEKVCLMGGIVTALLLWGTGQWERGIRWPRRWVWTANRGLRGFNCKLVVIKQSWWAEVFSTLSFFFSYGLFSSTSGDTYRFVEHPLTADLEKTAHSGGYQKLPNINEHGGGSGYEEDLSPGGDYIKLLLLPKPFSPNFRENWDIYRTEYWEKENERRAALRKKIKVQDLKLAKQQGGWLWWTGYRGWKHKSSDVEKLQRQGGILSEHKRTRSTTATVGSHSRNSSRSSIPTTELEDGADGRARRGGSAASERRKKKLPVGKTKKLDSTGFVTPTVHSPLARENSYTSVSSLDSERPATPAGDSVRSLRSGSLKMKPAAMGVH